MILGTFAVTIASLQELEWRPNAIHFWAVGAFVEGNGVNLFHVPKGCHSLIREFKSEGETPESIVSLGRAYAKWLVRLAYKIEGGRRVDGAQKREQRVFGGEILPEVVAQGMMVWPVSNLSCPPKVSRHNGPIVGRRSACDNSGGVDDPARTGM